MRTHILFLSAIAAMFVACRGERTVVEKQPGTVTEKVIAAEPADLSDTTVENVIPLIAPVAKRCEAKADPNGVVSMTIWLTESPEDLQVSMRVRDSNDDEVASVMKPAKGANVITLALDQKLAAGKYRVEGVWGGNVACERDVVVAE
jgi:hypothetical protein